MDLFLVFVVGMGIAGAGWATTLSQCAAAAFLASRLLGRQLLRATDLLQKPDLARLMPIIKVCCAVFVVAWVAHVSRTCDAAVLHIVCLCCACHS